ncbi:hypothetical protein RISK_004492 [Rhodopirellula islandica]|uniref:Uncharacterized protein n=1 Tax=Rhodopirellula islandica TaxID=595434 RepID=A0A0J1BAE9_RHOIS|nr:hypothetical protein [Rhodopirellula islandica]KLU03488.1 hypothetical protein RISK_004492 [Rhodopirellula islandica]
MSGDPSEFDAQRLYGVMTALVCCNDGDLIDDPACFPCSADSRAFWLDARDMIAAIRTDYDYVASPEFTDSIAGKSDQYVTTATRMAAQKSAEYKSDFDAAIQDALNSDRIFDLIPTSAHAGLREILAEINA